MQRFVENPGKLVLCIGHISEDGRDTEAYRDRLRSLYHTLAAEGYDTYLFTTWGRLEALSAGTLQITKPELIKSYGLDYVYSMGVFDNSRPMLDTPPASDYLDEILLPQDDDEDLTSEALFATLLAEVSAVMYDNSDNDPFVHAIVTKAFAWGKRMIDISDSGHRRA